MLGKTAMSNTCTSAIFLLTETIQRIEGAYAPSTIRAYSSDFSEYIAYCEDNELEVFPPNPITLAEFINHLSEKGVRSATIRRSVAGISTVYRLNRMPDPSKDPEVVIAMKRMHRKLGRAAKQAQGITSDLLEKLLTATGNSPRGIRDSALLLIAYDTLCRRSELVSLDIEDVKTTVKDGISYTTILLRRSKTDQESTGRWLHLSTRTQIALNKWLELIKEKEGPLFRGIASTHKLGTRLSAGQVNRIYKYTARNAKLDNNFIKSISGHSCRVGAAQDLVRSGASLPIIMSRGRWSKTDTVMRYVEHINHSQF
jgi:site-specific recombinase XerD